MMGALLLVVTLASAGPVGSGVSVEPAAPDDPAAVPSQSTAASDLPSEAAFTVAGSSAAGFVGGLLVAMPVLFSLLPVGGPFVAGPVAAVAVASGSAFGAFVGELPYARPLPAALVGAIGAAGTLLGVCAGGTLGGLLGGALESQRTNGVSLIVGALGGGVLGGIAGSAAGAAGGALWLTPDEP